MRLLMFLLLMLIPLASFGGITQSGQPQLNAAVLARNGNALFAGIRRFQNGGPPCAACHSASGLRFPNGGSLGPDLSRVTSKLGPEGVDVALQTLYFPTMRPIFDAHPLTVFEQRDLKTFFSQSQRGPMPPNILPVLVSTAVLGLLILLFLVGMVWRNRLRDVRESFVRSAPAGDAMP